MKTFQLSSQLWPHLSNTCPSHSHSSSQTYTCYFWRGYVSNKIDTIFNVYHSKFDFEREGEMKTFRPSSPLYLHLSNLLTLLRSTLKGLCVKKYIKFWMLSKEGRGSDLNPEKIVFRVKYFHYIFYNAKYFIVKHPLWPHASCISLSMWHLSPN